MREEIITIIVASLPISELRGAIPLALGVFKFSIMKAFLLSIMGNIILIMPFLFFLQKFSGYLMNKWSLYNKVMGWVFERTRQKHLSRIQEHKWVYVALFSFVAIPLPITGAWSGSVVAYLLGIPYWRSIGTIFLGIIAAGIIVTILFQVGFLAVQKIPL